MKNNSQFVPTYLYCIRVIRVESDFKLSIKKQAWIILTEYLLWIQIRLLYVLFQSFLNELLFHLELFQVFFRDNGWCPLHSPFTLPVFSPSI